MVVKHEDLVSKIKNSNEQNQDELVSMFESQMDAWLAGRFDGSNPAVCDVSKLFFRLSPASRELILRKYTESGWNVKMSQDLKYELEIIRELKSKPYMNSEFDLARNYPGMFDKTDRYFLIFE